MKNSKVSAKSAKQSKTIKAKEANEVKNTMTIEQFAIEIEQMPDKMTEGAKKYKLPYLKSHATNREFMQWNEDTKEFDIPTGKFAVRKTNEAIILFFDNKEYIQDYLRNKYFINKNKRTYEARGNKTTTDPDELERQAAELERQAAEKRAKAAEIRNENEEFEKLATANGWSVEEAKEMHKYLKKIRAKAEKANA